MGVLEGSYLGKILLTFIMSMVPVIELRGAIPIGVGYGLDLWFVVFLAIVGNFLPVPFIMLFIRKIFAWMRKVSKKFSSIVDRMEEKAAKHTDKVTKYGFWGLLILVAIPLPGTGAWTGALVAAMMEIRFKTALPAIFLGVLVAAVIVTFVTYGVSVVVF